ncbi:MAG: arginine repressor [Bdellovibrionaceae bacterium]|nr:arginine repressor [Pseudobdellovibrionaceae bacterium]
MTPKVSKNISDTKDGATSTQSRIDALFKILKKGDLGTQEEFVDELRSQKFNVTQSTVSRDLRRLGAIKVIDSARGTVYRLPQELEKPLAPSANFKDHIVDINHNGHMIVIHTIPGSASLIARHIDARRADGFLGTIAGDDTVFVAPRSVAEISKLIGRIESDFNKKG